jgi:hypothetical protein
VSGTARTVSNVIVTFGSAFSIPSIALGGVMAKLARAFEDARRGLFRVVGNFPRAGPSPVVIAVHFRLKAEATGQKFEGSCG